MTTSPTSCCTSWSTACEPISPAPPITTKRFPRISKQQFLLFGAHQLRRRPPAMAFAAARAAQFLPEPLPAPAHPAYPTSRIADHQRKRRNVLGDHRARSDKAVLSKRVTAND